MGLILESLTAELVLLLVSLITGLYLYSKYAYKYFERIGVPALEPKFPLGNTWDIITLKRGFGGFVYDFYYEIKSKAKNTKLGGYFQLLEPQLLIIDPDYANLILIREFGSFQSHGFNIDDEVNPLDGHLANLSGPKWRAVRNKLTPAFTSGKLKWMFGTMDEVVNHLIEYLTLHQNEDIDTKDLMGRFTTDVIGSCAFGLDPGAIENSESEFITMGKKIFRPSKKMFMAGLFRFFMPNLAIKLKVKTIPDELNDFFFSIVKQAFDHRLKTGNVRNDFIQLLLQLREKGQVDMDPRDSDEIANALNEHSEAGDEFKLVFTDALLTAQAFIFFLGGFESTSASISFTSYLLANNQEVQDKLRKEVREMKTKYNGITYDAVKNMEYLNCVVQESMRIYPPFPLLIRRSNKPFTFPDGTSIDAGIGTIIPLQAMHMDPDNYPEPDKFRPERFLPGTSHVPGSYLPFGDGPRSCIAKRFALLEVKLATARLIDNFKITKSPKLIEPVELDPKVFVSMPKNDLLLNFNKIPTDI